MSCKKSMDCALGNCIDGICARKEFVRHRCAKLPRFSISKALRSSVDENDGDDNDDDYYNEDADDEEEIVEGASVTSTGLEDGISNTERVSQEFDEDFDSNAFEEEKSDEGVHDEQFEDDFRNPANYKELRQGAKLKEVLTVSGSSVLSKEDEDDDGIDSDASNGMDSDGSDDMDLDVWDGDAERLDNEDTDDIDEFDVNEDDDDVNDDMDLFDGFP